MAKSDAGGKLTARRRMLSLKINELSAVDRPAQEGARALILKRDGTEGVAKRGYLTDVGGSDQCGQHQHLVYVNEDVQSGSTDYSQGHSHPFVRNKDGTVEVGIAMGHTHAVGLSKKIEKQEPAMTEKTQEVKDLEAKLAKATADVALATLVAALTDAEKVHYGTLADAAKAEFLAKSADERKVIVKSVLDEARKAAADADPVVFKSAKGVEYRKSHGDVVIALARQLDEQSAELAKARSDNEASTYSKRAVAETGNLPGKVESRAALLKAIDGIKDEELRKEALAAVVAGNKALKKAFTVVGTEGAERSEVTQKLDDGTTGDEPTSKADAEAAIDELAKKYAADKKVDFTKAYSHVLGTPEGRALYAKTAA